MKITRFVPIATALVLYAAIAFVVAPAPRAEEPVVTLPQAPDAPAEIAAPVGTAFTYQGKLDRSGAPATSTCNFQFSLWDALNGGAQIGSTQTINGVAVSEGLFTVALDFGSGAFAGNARWLEISVQCSGDGGFTALAPRQPVTPAPYAMYALGGSAGITLPYANSANSPSQTAFDISNTATSGLFHGVHGKTNSTAQNACGVRGDGLASSGLTSGVQGYAVNSPDGTGVVGIGAANGAYFRGENTNANGIQSAGRGTGFGVYASSESGIGVDGEATSGLGVFGRSQTGVGVFGQAIGNSAGVAGRSEGTTGQGVYGYAPNGALGVWGVAELNNAVQGQTNSGGGKAGVYGSANQSSSYGGLFENYAGGVALRATGRTQVTVLEILGADLAERFDVKEPVEPGTVVALDPEEPGRLRMSRSAYDKRVAGVVSGANDVNAGVILNHDMDNPENNGAPIAMAGRAWVKCDATKAAIRVGDLITTADRAGYAMRAVDRERSQGAILGKAMSALEGGTGLVLVLVNLQ